jgi:hypothetical protein
MADLVPSFDPSLNYYVEFWKLYLTNEVTLQQLQQVSHSVTKLRKKVTRKERLMADGIHIRKQHNRRKATEIPRKFECLEPDCHKTYGSEVSLNLHVKLKHLIHPDTAPLA